MTLKFDKLRSLAKVEDAWTESTHVSETVRRRLFSRPPPVPSRSTARKVVWIGGTCAALGLAAAFAITVLPKKSSLSFAIGGYERRGSIGNWINASDHEILPLSFSDGTQLILQQAAQARVTELQVNGAHVTLERGRLTASVVHQPGTRWELQAGPFTVYVRGTRFNLRWSPESSAFALDLAEGNVDVTGPGISGHRSVKTGQSLRVNGGAQGWHVEDASANSSSDLEKVAAPAAADNSPVSDIRDLPVERATASAPSSKDTLADSTNWQDLAAAGNYKDALSLARKFGLSKIYVTGSAIDLTKLAHVARFAGDAETARDSLRSIRERFAGSPESAMAMFDLGRLAFDTSGRYLEAAHWFSEYLREFPHGTLEREARGRLVESLERGGDHQGARKAASEYLLDFPNGPHSGLSRRLLNQ